jgi:hypothetical protein
MSPVEAKAYGIIDGVIGGDTATMVVEGDVTGVGPSHPTYPEAQSLHRCTHNTRHGRPRPSLCVHHEGLGRFEARLRCAWPNVHIQICLIPAFRDHTISKIAFKSSHRL